MSLIMGISHYWGEIGWLKEIKPDWPTIKALRTVSQEIEKDAGIETLIKSMRLYSHLDVEK